jgi:hypothetical protein
MGIKVESVAPPVPEKSLFIGDSRSGKVWKQIEWKKIMSGFNRKGTLLRIYDAAPSATSSVQRTVPIGSICFSREMAVVPPVLESPNAAVSYAYVMAVSDERGHLYVFDFVKNKYLN